MAVRVFVPGTAVKRTRRSQYLIDGHGGTAEAGAATTLTLQVGRASVVDDAYNGQWVVILSGTGLQQARAITDYVGSTRVATVAAWTVNPAADSVYRIMDPNPVAEFICSKGTALAKNGVDRLAKVAGEIARDSPFA